MTFKEAECMILGRNQIVHPDSQAAIEERRGQVAAGECEKNTQPASLCIFSKFKSGDSARRVRECNSSSFEPELFRSGLLLVEVGGT